MFASLLRNKKIETLDFIKIKIGFVSKDTMKEVKNSEWEKAVENHISEEVLISKIFKETL